MVHHFRPVAVPSSFFQTGTTRIRSDTRMIAVDNLNLFEHIPAALRNELEGGVENGLTEVVEDIRTTKRLHQLRRVPKWKPCNDH